MRTATENPGTSYSVPLLEGDAGTEQTVELMRQAVRAGLQVPFVWQTARRIFPNSTYHDDPGQVRKVFAWVKNNIRFMRDPYGQETVSTPERTLEQGFGDCDDITVLMAALLGSLGYRTRIVTVASTPHTEQFTHVYPEVLVRGRWVAVDAARPGAAFGKTVPRYSRKRVWDVTNGEPQDVAGLNGEYLGSQTVLDQQGNVIGYTTGAGDPRGRGTIDLPGGITISVDKNGQRPGTQINDAWNRVSRWFEGETFGIPNWMLAGGVALLYLRGRK